MEEKERRSGKIRRSEKPRRKVAVPIEKEQRSSKERRIIKERRKKT